MNAIMKQNKLNLAAVFALLVMMVSAFSFTSCGKDDSEGAPYIDGVKILTHDTLYYNADEYYTEAYAGATISIIGDNLSSVKKVYINNVSVYVNPNYKTRRNIIVTIPDEAAGSDVNQIRVVTDHGEATYTFVVPANSNSAQEGTHGVE